VETENEEEEKNLFSSEFWYLLNTSLFGVGVNRMNKILWKECSPILCYCPSASLFRFMQEIQYFPVLGWTFFGIAFQLFHFFSRPIFSGILQLVVFV